jgi:hypothetical protein
VDLPEIWGATPAERAAPYPCDGYVRGPVEAWFRAVDVDASPAAMFRWLCQLRVAPYSYDLVDNLGRRSPRELTPGLDDLAVGQRMMTIFTLVDFVRDRELTVELTDRRARLMFGDLAVTYRTSKGRLVAKLAVAATPLSWPRRRLLAWGDLVMMRRQLHNLGTLAAGAGHELSAGSPRPASKRPPGRALT